MKKPLLKYLQVILLGFLGGAANLCSAATPIELNPANPHYFLFRGLPTILIGSTEHYGAVLNLDFDYLRYLDELHVSGLNLTRTFSGSYREVPGLFKIADNTLAPRPERYVCPWERSSISGAADGGNKFDLERWSKAYFERLTDFVAQAGKRGIIVEFVLFCTLYNDPLWNANPFNSSNNINGIGSFPRQEVYTLQHPRLLAFQDAMVRKIVRELRDFDNVFYEVINEPYFGGVSDDWQAHIIKTLVDSEPSGPAHHLIAQNVANVCRCVGSPNPAVSIFNFHYAYPPVAVVKNYGLGKPISFDETGFAGSADRIYRTQAWAFILAGGSAFDNLDYSFTTTHPDGTAKQNAPGGGSPNLRAEYSVLKQFIEGFDFTRMVPKPDVIQAGAIRGPEVHRPCDPLSGANEAPHEPEAWVLADEGHAYAIYIEGGSQVSLQLSIPPGDYKAEWINTLTGRVNKLQAFHQAGELKVLRSPEYSEDIALRITRSHPL